MASTYHDLSGIFSTGERHTKSRYVLLASRVAMVWTKNIIPVRVKNLWRRRFAN
jgi:hypothetical protein